MHVRFTEQRSSESENDLRESESDLSERESESRYLTGFSRGESEELPGSTANSSTLCLLPSRLIPLNSATNSPILKVKG